MYPKARAVEIAKANKQDVLSMPSEMAANITLPTKSAKEEHVVAMRNAPVKSTNPAGQDVDKETHTETAASPTQVARNTEHLPKTASNLPLVGLIGMLALSGALTLRVISKRMAG